MQTSFHYVLRYERITPYPIISKGFTHSPRESVTDENCLLARLDHSRTWLYAMTRSVASLSLASTKPSKPTLTRPRVLVAKYPPSTAATSAHRFSPRRIYRNHKANRVYYIRKNSERDTSNAPAIRSIVLTPISFLPFSNSDRCSLVIAAWSARICCVQPF